MKFKVILGLIVIIALLAIAGFFAWKYNPKNSLQDYKKLFFDSTLCEYKCPLTEQTINNKTMLAPDGNCVQSCTLEFKKEQGKFNSTQMDKDGFLTEIKNVANNCRAEATNISAKKFDNVKFFNCTASGLENMKLKYDYLN